MKKGEVSRPDAPYAALLMVGEVGTAVEQSKFRGHIPVTYWKQVGPDFSLAPTVLSLASQ